MRLIDLADRYDAVLLDAYGVLVDARGALPGAADAVAELLGAGVELYVATNDASRLPETVAGRLGRLGIEIAADRILTSGALLGPYFADRGLAGARCIVLGPGDSRHYVEQAGGRVIETAADADCDAVVVCDEAGFDFLPAVEATLTALFRQLDGGRRPALVQPNPDLIYPKEAGSFGFTSGAVALLLEAGLARRYPDRGLRFDRLGKPHPPFFARAIERAGSRNLLMVGDQMETDIAGARRAGIDAALLTTGVTRLEDAARDPAIAPTYLLDRL